MKDFLLRIISKSGIKEYTREKNLVKEKNR